MLRYIALKFVCTHILFNYKRLCSKSNNKERSFFWFKEREKKLFNAVDDSVSENSNRITRLPNTRDIFSVGMGNSYTYLGR